MTGTMAITMAGFGSRFAEAGYKQPKYWIDALGLPLFDWSMLSLVAFRDAGWRFAFAVRAADQSDAFIRERCTALGIAIGDLRQLDRPTDGQATTARLLAQRAPPDAPFAVFNIDTFVRPGAMTPDLIPAGAHGWVPCFSPAPGDDWSFARLDAASRVVELREKVRISPHATVGLYWFNSADLYLDAYERYFGSGRGEEKGERYIAPLYNQLIADRRDVYIASLTLADVGMLGTPAQVEAFRADPPAAARQIIGGARSNARNF